jgi:hypothetical protein
MSSAPETTIPRRALLAATAGGGVLLLAACSQSSSKAAGASPTQAPTPAIPSVTSVSPASGSLSGGTAVTVSGKNLRAASTIVFGSGEPLALTAVSDTEATVTSPMSVDYAAVSVPLQLIGPRGQRIDTAQNYEFAAVTPVDKQMLYAFTYWKNYNTAEWGVFTGNDCGNFVNQTLVQRGWKQSRAWYSDYATTGGFSLSWVRGTPMFDYLSSRPDVTHYSVDQREKVKVGDVVMFDWDPKKRDGVDHTMVVSKVEKNVDGTIAIKLVGHTVDAQYRDLDTAITAEHPGGTAHFFSIAS